MLQLVSLQVLSTARVVSIVIPLYYKVITDCQLQSVLSTSLSLLKGGYSIE